MIEIRTSDGMESYRPVASLKNDATVGIPDFCLTRRELSLLLAARRSNAQAKAAP
jgi:hypothetical protein